jgi:mannose-6-phosphate isomerase-like protein (cupin superfamily)
MPDARLLDRVEQTLMDTIALQPGMHPITHLAAPHANGRARPTTQPPRLQPIAHPAMGQWLLPRVATAALIALMLIGSVAAFRGFRPAPNTDESAIIPAWEGTPEATLPPGVTEATTLLDQRVDDIPAGAGWAGIEQLTLGPGAGMTMGTNDTSGVGPLFYRVESGAVTGQAEGTALVTRAGAASAFPIAAGQPIDLAAGDVAFVPSGIASKWRNATGAPAEVMDAGLTGMGVDTKLVNGIVVPGWSEGNVLAFSATIDSTPRQPLKSPAMLHVQRIGLAPGGTMENPPTPDLAFIGVESGSVTLIAADPAASSQTRTLKAHEWIGVNGASADLLQGGPYDTREFRNDGDANATFLLMTISPIAAVATPEATPAASAFASEPLLDTLVPGGVIPESTRGTTIWLFSHYAVNPSERVTYPNDCSAPDFTVRSVLDGTYTVKPTGPMTVLRNAAAGESAPREQVAPGQEVTLDPGDALVYQNTTNDDFAGFRNAGSAQLDLLQWEWLEEDCLSSVPLGMQLDWDLWTRWSGAKPEWVQFDPARPFEIRFHRMTAPPGTALPQDGPDGPGFLPVGAPGLEAAAAEAGKVEVTKSAGSSFPYVLQTASPAGGSVTSDATLPAGTTRTIRSTGDEPLLMYDLTIMNTGEASAATPVAQGSGTPTAATGEETLFHQVLDAIPADAMWAGIERAVIDPGKDWPQGSPQTTTGLGPMLYRVERGVATVHVEGQIAVTRTGAQTSSPIAAGTDVALDVGDIAYVPTGVLTDWRNEQASPLVILDAGVANPWGVPPPPGVQKSSPIDADYLEIPHAPAELTVRRLTLPPGASIAGGPGPGLKLVAVEAGTLTIDWANRADRAASGQPPGATPAPRELLPRDYRAGSWADVNRAGALGLAKGAKPSATTLRNDGNEPVTLLVLTVVSMAPDATPAGS